MSNNQVSALEDCLDKVYALIAMLRDSCEFHMFSSQQVVLELARKYLSESFELLSRWEK